MASISKRLLAVASMVTPGSIVADIGCDHAYLSIYLIRNNICDRVIACDINKGPLDIARINVSDVELLDKIELRLSDGLHEIHAGEVDSVVIAGMGGKVMAKIIEEGSEVLEKVHEMILEPQSEVPFFRHFLEENGYRIISEDMVYEDDKFYPIIKVIHGQMDLEEEVYYRYSKILLREENPVLHQYLFKEKEYLGKLLAELSENKEVPKVAKRIDEVRYELALCQTALTIITDSALAENDRIIE